MIRLPISRRRAFDLAAIAAAAAGGGVLALHYLRFTRPKPPLGMPPFDFELLSKIINGFTTTALEIAAGNLFAWVLVAIAVFGAVVAIRGDRANGVALAAMALLPLVLTLVALSLMRHWFSIRYVSPALPAFILLLAVGIDSIASRIRQTRVAKSVAIAAGAAIAVATLPNSLHEPTQKVDWRGAAMYIAAHAKPGDPVVTSNDWSMICVSFYLRQIGSNLAMTSADESPERVKTLVAERHGWIVEGGWHSNGAIVEWLTNLCEVWTSPTASQFESLRVRFYPDCRAFLEKRVTPEDVALLHRWFVHERRSRLEMTDYDDRFLIEAWSDPEVDPSGPTFRWVDGRTATVLIPMESAGAKIRFRARALGYPNAPPQQVRLSVNGSPSYTTTLGDRWSEHETASTAFRAGVNEVVFEFSRATRPMDVDPNATDPRQLSAAFDFIEVARPR